MSCWTFSELRIKVFINDSCFIFWFDRKITFFKLLKDTLSSHKWTILRHKIRLIDGSVLRPIFLLHLYIKLENLSEMSNMSNSNIYF